MCDSSWYTNVNIPLNSLQQPAQDLEVNQQIPSCALFHHRKLSTQICNYSMRINFGCSCCCIRSILVITSFTATKLTTDAATQISPTNRWSPLWHRIKVQASMRYFLGAKIVAQQKWRVLSCPGNGLSIQVFNEIQIQVCLQIRWFIKILSMKLILSKYKGHLLDESCP